MFAHYRVRPKKSINEFCKSQRIQKYTRNRGSTAMHIAASSGRADILKCLLHYHPDYTIEDLNGQTPLELALKNGHKKCAKMIVTYQDDESIKKLYDNIEKDFNQFKVIIK